MEQKKTSILPFFDEEKIQEYVNNFLRFFHLCYDCVKNEVI
ncbi:MAG: hypothetical protein WC430_03545 [Patescibacteria group bacterium]